MTEIVINGTPLHRVQMLLESEVAGSVVHLSYPSERLRVAQDGDELELMVPAFLALELYRLGLLSEEENAAHEIAVGGKNLGTFYFGKLTYPRVRIPTIPTTHSKAKRPVA